MANDLDRTTTRFAAVYPDLLICRELGWLRRHTPFLGGDHTVGDVRNSSLGVALRHVEASETDRSNPCDVRNEWLRKGLDRNARNIVLPHFSLRALELSCRDLKGNLSSMEMKSAVNHQVIIATYEVLLDLGFQPDDTVLSRDCPSLRFDFG